MTTGQPDDTTPQHGSPWQEGRRALNRFLASFPSGSVTIASGGSDTFHLCHHGKEKLGPFCTLALSDDCLQMVIRRGDQTWRASITRAHWLLDGSEEIRSSEDMVKELTGHSPRAAPLKEGEVASLLRVLERCPDLRVGHVGSNTAIYHPEYPRKRLVISDMAGPTIIHAYVKDETQPKMLA